MELIFPTQKKLWRSENERDEKKKKEKTADQDVLIKNWLCETQFDRYTH
jgi:hypothetical protein